MSDKTTKRIMYSNYFVTAGNGTMDDEDYKTTRTTRTTRWRRRLQGDGGDDGENTTGIVNIYLTKTR